MAYQRYEDLIRAIVEDVKGIKNKGLRQAAEFARADVLEIFKSEGRSHDLNWPELNEKYLEYKLKKGYSEKILQKTTTLKQSIFADVKSDYAIVGTPVFYSIFHEEGTDKIPKRPFFKPAFENLKRHIPNIVASIFEGM